MRRWSSLALVLALAGCDEGLPADVVGYAERCVRMNDEPLPQTADDPHDGEKHVYACNVPRDALVTNTRPFPDGTLIVKEATRPGAGFPWLVATARKRDGAWRWDEYTRNFADEPFARILAGQGVCTDCHRRVRAVDWIFTGYTREDVPSN